MKYPIYSEFLEPTKSGVEPVPPGWEVRRLKFSATYNDESLPETTDPNLEIQYVDISSVDLIEGVTAVEKMMFENAPSRARRVVRDGDTIISTVRTYLKAIAPIKAPPDNMIVSTGFAVIRPQSCIDSRFLGYALQGAAFIDAVVANSTGISYPAINPSTLVCISITYPINIGEQQNVADFLDWKTGQIDALISKKKELVAKLIEQRNAIITQAVTQGLNPDIPMREAGVDWLGRVPTHWKVRRLKFTASKPLQYGANEAAELDDPKLPRYIRITDINADGTLRDDTFRSLPLEVAEPYLLEEGDILLARSGATVGKSFQYLASWGRAAYAGYLIRFRADPSVLTARFAYYFLRSQCYWACINSSLIQSTIENFSAEKYASINVPLPSVKEQELIVAKLEKQTAKIDKLEGVVTEAISRLIEYRSALITAATSGQIDVRKVKIGVAS